MTSSAPPRSTPCLSSERIIRGLVTAAYGRRFLVECADGITRDCVTRGKRNDFACGDDVSVAVQNDTQGAINDCAPRKSLLYRSDQWKQKLIAANVTQVVVVVAPVPSFDLNVLDCCLAAAGHANIDVLIVLNKADLIENKTANKEGLREVLDNLKEDLRFLAYAPVVLLSAKTGEDMDRLFKRVENVREAARHRIGTGPLNRLLLTAMTNHPPALKSGRRFKVLYGTQPEPKGNRPIPIPELVLFCNDKGLLEDSYRRFLEGRIRGVEPWEGLPIDLHLRERPPRGVARSRKGGSKATPAGKAPKPLVRPHGHPTCPTQKAWLPREPR